MAKFFYTHNSFEVLNINPFDNNTLYNHNWVIFKLLDEHPDFIMYTGKMKTDLFHAILTKKCKGWRYRIMDFINYEKEYDKNIIISIAQNDLDEAKRVYDNKNLDNNKLRYYEPKVLIHSTSLDCWESIQQSKCLKSWNVLKKENILMEEKPIGYLLGDPYDYSDYVMLGQGATCEIVVASKQWKKISMDVNLPYKPGVRLYFDAEKIAEDGLLVRDGFHYKVKNTLPLNKYLIWSATSENVDIESNKLTPYIFAKVADEMFQKKFSISL